MSIRTWSDFDLCVCPVLILGALWQRRSVRNPGFSACCFLTMIGATCAPAKIGGVHSVSMLGFPKSSFLRQGWVTFCFRYSKLVIRIKILTLPIKSNMMYLKHFQVGSASNLEETCQAKMPCLSLHFAEVVLASTRASASMAAMSWLPAIGQAASWLRFRIQWFLRQIFAKLTNLYYFVK